MTPSYYGIDYLATLLTIFGLWNVSSTSRKWRQWGFAAGFLACLVWIAVGLIADSRGIILTNVVLLFMYAKGWLRNRDRGLFVDEHL